MEILPKVLNLPSNVKLSYPIGDHMEQAISICTNMSDSLKLIYPEKSKLKFYVRGSSGAILGAIIATMMLDYRIIICHIKKDGEDSHSAHHRHSCKAVEAPAIIIDDFIITGSTIRAIYEAMEVEVDTLCVSGAVFGFDLPFKPRYVICGKFKKQSLS